MNTEAQEVLNDILQKNPEQLSVVEIAFLRARSGYLNNEQKRIFAAVLGNKEIKVKGKKSAEPLVAPEAVVEMPQDK